MEKPKNVIETGQYVEPNNFEHESEAILFWSYLDSHEYIEYLESLRKHNWIDSKQRTPELIKGQYYSKNVLAIINGNLGVACYCYNPSKEDSERGYFWANCYGNIDGDAEFDDDYDVTYWQHLPELI